jgi:recombination protein RecT
MSNALTKREPHLDKTLKLEERRAYLLSELKNEKFKSYYEGCLPTTLRKLMSADQAVNIIGRAATKTPAILDCTKGSIMQCLVDTAVLGLELAGPQKQAHILPFWNSKLGAKEATLIIGYEGYLELMYRSSTARGDPYYETIRVNWVYSNDIFTYNQAGREPPQHEIPWGKDRGEPVLVYLVAFFASGGHYFESMTWDEILDHRNRYAKQYTDKKTGEQVFSGAWEEIGSPEFMEMGKKTIIRRAQKRLKKSADSMLGQASVIDEDRAPLGQRATIKDITEVLPDVVPQLDEPDEERPQGAGARAKASLKDKASPKEKPAEAPPAASPPPPPPEEDDDVVDAEFTEENPPPPAGTTDQPPESPQEPQEEPESEAPPSEDPGDEASQGEGDGEDDPLAGAQPPDGTKNMPKSLQEYLAVRAAVERRGLSGEEVDGIARDLKMDPENARTLTKGRMQVLKERVREMVRAYEAEMAKPEAPKEPEKKSKVTFKDKTRACTKEEFNSMVLAAKEVHVAEDATSFLAMARVLLGKRKIKDHKDITLQELEQLAEYLDETRLEQEAEDRE